MKTNEMCLRLGAAQWKSMLSELPSGLLKKLLAECKISTARSLSRLSTKGRNDDWIERIWANVNNQQVATVALYTWLGFCRQPMLVAFLDELGVKHTQGLTDDDFWNDASQEQLQRAAQALLDNGSFTRRDVAIYLLFLEATNQTSRLDSLDLASYLA